MEGAQGVLAEDHLSNQERREEQGDPEAPSGFMGVRRPKSERTQRHQADPESRSRRGHLGYGFALLLGARDLKDAGC